MFAADFLLSFDDEGEVAGEFGAGLEPGLDGLEVGEVLAFIVAGAAAEEGTAFDAGLERGGFPEVKGLRGLDIVVAVNDEMGTF